MLFVYIGTIITENDIVVCLYADAVPGPGTAAVFACNMASMVIY